MIDAPLEVESATRERDLKKTSRKNRTGTTGITEFVLGTAENHRIIEVRRDFWTSPGPKPYA